ncbi:uncharacterized protein LOC133901653 [Phragmites australis]|uniref:uncharacterized protein LOC133901653 n=1 Tax=Phragmites australis TaxID=29695 RepID=UPI002D78D71A|nr:uncharacterized protein LOC133901653 [Phragmites australis]
METEAMEETDLADPNPDVGVLFNHFDGLYFQGALAAAGFSVHWGSSINSSSFGSITFSKPRNTITLSEPVLRYRSTADRKKALLHEMIHAIIYIKFQRKDRAHGPIFRDWVDAINSCPIEDDQRPRGGYNLTTRHDFGTEEPRSVKTFLWKCKSCGDTLVRPSNQGPPSDACCIENVCNDDTCRNMLCRWHNHKKGCRGTYAKVVHTDQKEDPRGTQLRLICTSEMSKSQGASQESDAAALQENATATKPKPEGKLLSLASASSVKLQGSSSSKKAGKRHRPEDGQKLKLNQSLAASEKHELFSPVGCDDTKSPGSSTSKMAGKRRKLEDVQKPSVPPATIQGKLKQDIRKPSGLLASSPRKLKLNQSLAASEKHDLFSSLGCNDKKSLGSSTSKMAGKRRKLEDVQKSSVPPAATQGNLKLKEDLVASENNKLLPLLYCGNAQSPQSSSSKKARKQHNPESTQKTCSLRKPKQNLVAPEKNELFSPVGCSNSRALDGSSSKKARKRHEAEDIQKATVLPAAPQSKLKQSSFVASKKQKSKCKRKPASEKEYAVMSVYLDYYESDRSSGSTEPLLNKRTELRKKERARIRTYSLSKKINFASLEDSGINVSVSSHRIMTEPRKDESAQLSRPPSPCSGVDQVVTQKATEDQSQPPAPCLDIVTLQPADPLGLIPPDQSIGPGIIDISDDD